MGLAERLKRELERENTFSNLSTCTGRIQREELKKKVKGQQQK